jgi:gas vesicle protein
MRNKLTGIGLFAAGAGIGAAIALLYAPRAGKHTRARLRNTANRAVDRLEEVRDDVRSHMSDWVDEASEAIASNIASGKETGERVLENVRERFQEGKERVEQYVRSVAG